jgi:hypothetical protein
MKFWFFQAVEIKIKIFLCIIGNGSKSTVMKNSKGKYILLPESPKSPCQRRNGKLLSSQIFQTDITEITN